MANITTFDAASVPVFLKRVERNTDMTAHASLGFPVISIKGKVFTIVRNGERHILPNPKDPESAATYMTCVLVKVSPDKSKSYYEGGFSENAESNKPTCFSCDGKYPDPSVQKPQCKSCAACRHNVFGTARSADGKGKGKACSDFIRIALATPDNLDDVYLLRVPPASIRAVGEYGTLLDRRGVPYQAVVTKISFDPAQATPKLVFAPVQYLTEEQWKKAMEVSKGDVVRHIIYGNYEQGGAAPSAAPHPVPTNTPEEVPAPVTKAESTADALIAETMGITPDTKPTEAATGGVAEGSLEDALNSIDFS